MTVHVIQSSGHNGSAVRCDLCEHRFEAAVTGQSAAEAFARINGWVVGETTVARCARLPVSAERQTPVCGTGQFR